MAFRRCEFPDVQEQDQMYTGSYLPNRTGYSEESAKYIVQTFINMSNTMYNKKQQFHVATHGG